MTTAWRVLGLSRRVNLEKRGIVLDSILFVMCGKEDGTRSLGFRV